MAERRIDCDVVVVGAGPAGLSAVRAASRHGARVLLVDAQPQPGGQIWRRDVHAGKSAVPRELHDALRGQQVELLAQAEVVACEGRRLLVRAGQAAAIVSAATAVVVATGARELLLPFPGWTLPGVTGAGGAQALLKQGWPLRGKRVVLAGSGPLLLAAADTLRRHGAKVLGIHEQAAAAKVAAFAAGLWRWPGKLLQAARLRAALCQVAYRTSSHVLRALGDQRLQAVQLHIDGRAVTLDCDLLACGFGLVPNIEVAQTLGCELTAVAAHPHVLTDEWQRTSIAGVLAAGEACGIGGVDCARVEGTIAGLVAVERCDDARALWPQRVAARRFASALQKTFALHDGLRALADPDTIVCRCEDVRFAEVSVHGDAREAKLMTRFGMGPCQGRICGTALAEIRGVARGGFRPPIFPVPLDVLAGFGSLGPADLSQE